MTFRGDVRGSGTPKILRTILQSGESGVLSFWNGVFTKRVFVSRSRIVQITSNDPDERLGENGRAHAGKIICAGAENNHVPALLGWDRTDTLSEAIEEARDHGFRQMRLQVADAGTNLDDEARRLFEQGLATGPDNPERAHGRRVHDAPH